MSTATILLVRLVHVVGMTLVLGGTAFVWAILRAGDPGRMGAGGSTASSGDQTPLAALYELVFWAVMGVMVVAGIGNLDALGPPGSSGRWGSFLTARLLAVTAFVPGSPVRTLVVFRLRRSGPTGLGRSLLAKSYGATIAALLVLTVLAEVLAHE